MAVFDWYDFFKARHRDASPKAVQIDLSTGAKSVQTELGRPFARCFVIIAGSGVVRVTWPDGGTSDLTLAEGTARQYQFTALERVSGTITTVEIAL